MSRCGTRGANGSSGWIRTTRFPRIAAGSSAGLIDRDVDPSVLGHVIQVHCPGGGEDGDAETDVTVVDHVKLIRNRPDLRFEGRIHEQILPAIRRAGGTVAWTDLYVVHSGSDPGPEAQERKAAARPAPPSSRAARAAGASLHPLQPRHDLCRRRAV